MTTCGETVSHCVTVSPNLERRSVGGGAPASEPDGSMADSNKLSIEIERLKAAAAIGSAEAMFKLGEKFEIGEGVAVDATEAAVWWNEASKHGHADAQFCLGTLYREGSGVPQSDREAAKYLTQSAKQGHVEAAAHLGWMYKLGHGVAISMAECVVHRAMYRHHRARPRAPDARPRPRVLKTHHMRCARACARVLRNSCCPPCHDEDVSRGGVCSPRGSVAGAFVTSRWQRRAAARRPSATWARSLSAAPECRTTRRARSSGTARRRTRDTRPRSATSRARPGSGSASSAPTPTLSRSGAPRPTAATPPLCLARARPPIGEVEEGGWGVRWEGR